MSDDPELQRLRRIASKAAHRYWRLEASFLEPAVLAAAHEIWVEAAAAVQAYEDQKAVQDREHDV